MRRPTSGLGVAGRLIALAMVPVTGMALIAGSVLVFRQGSAERAGDIGQSVPELSALADLSDSLNVELFVSDGEAGLEARHLTAAQLVPLIGYDFETLRDPARGRSDRAITSLGKASPVGGPELVVLRQQVDSHALTATAASAAFRSFVDAAGGALRRRVNDLEVLARASGSEPVGSALESLRLASDVVAYGASQSVDFGDIWFPSGRVRPPVALAQVLGDGARYSEAANRLRQLGNPMVEATFLRIAADPLTQGFERAVLNAEQGVPPPDVANALGLAAIGKIFLGGERRYRLLDELIAIATNSVRDASGRLAESERTTFLEWAVGTAALAAISFIVALGIARSISSPLGRLADYAHAVNEGRLETRVVDVGAQGSSETRIVFDAVADLASNLRLLDAKAQALANCEFDNPILDEPLPGRLGRSLQSSVEVLSGSILEREHLQQRLAYQAGHDQLTGMPNRAAAIAGIQSALDRGHRSRLGVALVFLDLDDFKSVNDTHGHRIGDELLRQVGARLEGVLRGGELAARLGGDEFVVIAEGITDVDEAMALARRLIETLSHPVDIESVHLGDLGASAGIAMALDGPDDPLRLLARADLAMYRAKGRGRASIEIFDADLQRQLLRREDVEGALAAALGQPGGGGLTLHYQPVVQTASGAISSVEALVRWERPGHGLVQPDDFIPVAEASALIIDLDRWVLSSAARQVASWAGDPALCTLTVAVNISGRHLLSRRLPDHIREVLGVTHIDPRRLTIEITETVLITDLTVASAELDAVRALGIRVAIDDFGTGYTSLAHLQQLPIDVIKIDRSFVTQLNQVRGVSLVRMITDLGHSMGVTIIAEGVETEQELESLRLLGADAIQGYLFSRPLPPDGLLGWVRARLAAAPGAGPASA